MTDAKVFFHSNLKLLRTRRKYSQGQQAELLGYTRAKYTAMENGKTENPPLVDLIKIAAFFKISVDDLVKSDLTRWSELELRKLETGGLEYVSGKKLRLLSITVNAENKENLEYVPVKAKAGYLAGHADPDFIAALPKFTLPNLPGGTFRMFPISGDSMLPLPSGSEVICRYVEDWREIKPHTPCILILNDAQDFVFKFVTMEESQFLLESLNPVFDPYTVDVSDVLEIWQFHSYQSRQMPEPPSDINQVGSVAREILADIRYIKSKF
ncbi:XRE family transcriptional regulator [Sphingobacterium detergens]|uniref:Transcriptional regulator with XRE-family HTH domain n=1 Tax=Sphingobacterium detergens TaxID=1145106 RepID=A0A420B6J7_SPHD1|nr:LexA family transcriptional regulator [Sphingobacterium detergens]RKE52410.1 transcriptional regulator with XRE-family HTH domain [Sphingobacterium detergens]